MSSFGSSFINKSSSSKKPAPKAPPQRKRPGTLTASSLASGTDTLRRSQTPQVTSPASGSPSLSYQQQPESEAVDSVQHDLAQSPPPRHEAADSAQHESSMHNHSTQKRTHDDIDTLDALPPSPSSAEYGRVAKRMRGESPSTGASGHEVAARSDVTVDRRQCERDEQLDGQAVTTRSNQSTSPQISEATNEPQNDQILYEEAHSVESPLQARPGRKTTGRTQFPPEEVPNSLISQAQSGKQAVGQGTSTLQNRPSVERPVEPHHTPENTPSIVGEYVANHAERAEKIASAPKRKPQTQLTSHRGKRSRRSSPESPPQNPWTPKFRGRKKLDPSAREVQTEIEDTTHEAEPGPETIRENDNPLPKTRKTRSSKNQRLRSTGPAALSTDQSLAEADVNNAHILQAPTNQAQKASPLTSNIARQTAKRNAQARRKRRSEPTRAYSKHHARALRAEGEDLATINAAEENPQSPANGNPSPNRSPRRPRESTSSEEEIHEVDLRLTAMWDLTHDTRKGQVSNLEQAFRNVNWAEVKKKKAEEQLRALESESEHGDEGHTDQPDEVTERLDRADQQAQGTAGNVGVVDATPGMKIVNGQLVFDTSTLAVDNAAQANAEAEAAAAEEASNAERYEESDITNPVNMQSWVNAHRRDKRERIPRVGGRWSESCTNKFYDAIRMFGADFTIIQKMFPDKTRRQIKLKFVREERVDPQRIKEAMVGPTDEKIPMSLAQYAEWTGEDENGFRDPEELNRELAAAKEKQQKELEEEELELQEHAKKKREKAKERQKVKDRGRRAQKKGNGQETNEDHGNANGEIPNDEGVAVGRARSVDTEREVHTQIDDEDDGRIEPRGGGVTEDADRDISQSIED